MKQKRNPFPGVTSDRDRHGKLRYRLRKKINGVLVDVRLPGPYASEAFREAYDAAISGARSAAPGSGATFATVQWVIEHYLGSVHFKNLSEIRRKTLRSGMDWLRENAGEYHIGTLKTKHVEALMNRKAGPSAANNVRKNLSILFNFAIKHELAGQKFNPARYAEARKERPDGYHTWTPLEMKRFLDVHGPGTKARLAFLLMAYTGTARQDVIRLGWQNVQAGRIIYSRRKTGVQGAYIIKEDLQRELDQVPRDQMLFLTHSCGLPYKTASFANWFKDQCKAAGLPHCTIHGVRKGMAVLIAERGSSYEVMAFLAHKTEKEGSTYTKRAARVVLAETAISRVVGTDGEQTLSNLVQRLDINQTQGVEKKGKT